MGKWLSEVLDFERDIKGHRLIQIIAGVGAGKNRWVESLNDMGYRILLITSRRATADAQAKKLSADKWIDFTRLSDAGSNLSELPVNVRKTVVCTNAHIESVVKKYNPEDPKTHIWNKFDFIILDEAHSLATDATFTDAPFYVEAFLRYAYKKAENCTIIFMTGTPKPIKWLFGQDDVYTLDKFEECKHLEPNEVFLIKSAMAHQFLINNWKAGRRIIYFINSIARMEKLVI